MNKKKTDNEFEINGDKVKGMYTDSKSRKVVFVDKNGDVFISMVLNWAVIIAIVLWPLFVAVVMFTIMSGGSIKVERKK